MIRRVFTLSLSLFTVLVLSAEVLTDSAYLVLYHHYYQLFDTDSAKEFHEISSRLQQNFIEKGDMLKYFKFRQNEIYYDAAHEETYTAIIKTNDLLEEMKNSDVKHYELAYMTLGSIFEMRGTYRVAIHYYQKALDNIDETDSTGLAHIYSQMANINLARNAKLAQQWLKRMDNSISSDSLYYRSYLTLQGQMYFFNGDKNNFMKTKQEFDAFSERQTTLDHNGEHILNLMEVAFNGKYEKALNMLEEEVQDYDDIRRCDIRIRIYEMMGAQSMAVKETNRRRDIRDSLSNDMIFNNLNEINASIGMAKINEEAAKEREHWMGTAVILLLLALGLSISRYITYRRYQKKIEVQNQQLEKALQEAKESERMKDIFIQNISQEMRTPLNTITECTQAITDEGVELSEAETDKMLQDIGQNTVTIIDIVDDLLEVSLEGSKEWSQA